MTDGSKSAFRFSKHETIVSVQFEPPERLPACIRFVELTQTKIYKRGTHTVHPEYRIVAPT